MNIEELIDDLIPFINKEVVESQVSKILNLDFEKVDKFSIELAQELLNNPEQVLLKFENFLDPVGKSIKVRVYNLPKVLTVDVKDLGEQHLNKLIRVEGVVNLVSINKPRIKTAVFECVYCGLKHDVKVEASFDSINPPKQCKECGRDSFNLIEKECDLVNVQVIKIQDLIEKSNNINSDWVKVYLEEDLVNKVVPGDKVVITGVLKIKPIKEGKTKIATYDKWLDCIHVEKMAQELELLKVNEEDVKKIKELSLQPNLKELIVQSIASGVFGYDEIKLALILQMLGGTADIVLPDGQKVRNTIHILIIGEPGLAKSTLLQAVQRLSPKCITVSGKGVSGVGLTASVVKDESGGFVLKAGAMVLASGGQVNIDELDKMDPEDRSALHQAMEQGEISINKADIQCTLSTKTSVLASANPKFGRFDPSETITSQFDIPIPLLTRFDLIFPVKDVIEKKIDENIADIILKSHSNAMKEIKPPISKDLLRKYLSYAKSLKPVQTEESQQLIKNFYLDLREKSKKTQTYQITPRQIEGIIRLSEASAKLRLSDKVESQDAQQAIDILKITLKEVFTNENGLIDVDVIERTESKGKIQKIRDLISLITTLENEYDIVEKSVIIKKAEETLKLPPNETLKLIDDIKKDSYTGLYEPKPGFYKLRGRKWE